MQNVRAISTKETNQNLMTDQNKKRNSISVKLVAAAFNSVCGEVIRNLSLWATGKHCILYYSEYLRVP